MTAPRARFAVAPLRRLHAETRRQLPSVCEAVDAQRPEEPVHCLRPGVLSEVARRFTTLFPGEVLYAVKCNAEPALLRALHDGGIRHFDVASPAELRLIRQLFPAADVHYMHPVKARSAIRSAYVEHGCRTFALDSAQELLKIGDETNGARDLTLLVRLALPKGSAQHDLSGKFGALPTEAVDLLRASRRFAQRLGVSFHVGSQCLDPADYERALHLVGEISGRAGVPIEIVDVGGGFPTAYPGTNPPPLERFVEAVANGFSRLTLPADCQLWCEPGRALAASGVSVVVQVLHRRGATLYINDGMYGSLSDAGRLGTRHPARLIRPDGAVVGALMPFSLFGPTCDGDDRMPGPFLLPEDVREGDWIELGQLGAYGSALRTGFNGFDRVRVAEVRDAPLSDMPHEAAECRSGEAPTAS